MSGIKRCAAVATLLAAGCASAPERAAETALEAEDGTGEVTAAVTEAERSVLDLNEIALDPGQMVSCREMLKPASNVIVTRCMTGDDWKRFKRREELWAQQMLRIMQGGAYR